MKPSLWLAVLIGEIVWCIVAGHDSAGGSFRRTISLLAIDGFGMVLGAFFAFCFTSYGKDEEATFGKIRDWTLAGITGAGLAEIMEKGGAVKHLLLIFSPGSQPADFALAISTITFGFGAGFFFMFFQRELNLNVLLAESRASRARAEGAQNATIAVHELLNKLPVQYLTYVNEVSESEISKEERETLRDLLFSEGVNKFLKFTEERAHAGAPLEWDNVYKTALIQYYRAYFVPKEAKANQIHVAETWVQSALLMQPFHGALTIAYSDLKALQSDFISAAKTLKDLIANGDPPATAFQLLGFYLIEAGEDIEAIHYGESYLRLYPNDSVTMFNLAYSYGRLYCNEQDKSENRMKCLELLSKALKMDPSHGLRIKEKWIPTDFGCLQSDQSFTQLIGQAEDRISPSKSSEKGSGTTNQSAP